MMGNIARMANTSQTQIKRCLSGELSCSRCGEKAVSAIETAWGWKPACKKCAEEGMLKGYEVVWDMNDLKESEAQE